jgi:exodeoxyribonuclease VIII
MPNELYHSTEMKQQFVSKSGLDRIAQSPAHFKWFMENPTDETPALVFGSAFHTMILEPEKVETEIVKLPDSWPTKKECGRSIEDQKEEFRIIHRGKAILSADQMEMANAMAKSVEDHAAARFILQRDKGRAEVTALWNDVETGMDCRARFDWLREDGLIVDLKSTRCAKPEIFEKLAIDHRYHVQAAFYMEAYRQVFGREPVGFAFVAVEKEPPYCACVYVSQPDFLKLGRIEYLKNLTTYAECRKSNEYPGYPDISLVPLNLPVWAQRQLNAS